MSIGGKTSDPLPLLNTFDPDTGLGVQGDYEAALIPTAPGDYTFHLTGSIDGTAVDETATSSDSTFNSVVDSTGIQFPNQLPALTDIITRLDRIDARLAALPSPGTGAIASSAPSASGTPIYDQLDAANAGCRERSVGGESGPDRRRGHWPCRRDHRPGCPWGRPARSPHGSLSNRADRDRAPRRGGPRTGRGARPARAWPWATLCPSRASRQRMLSSPRRRQRSRSSLVSGRIRSSRRSRSWTRTGRPWRPVRRPPLRAIRSSWPCRSSPTCPTASTPSPGEPSQPLTATWPAARSRSGSGSRRRQMDREPAAARPRPARRSGRSSPAGCSTWGWSGCSAWPSSGRSSRIKPRPRSNGSCRSPGCSRRSAPSWSSPSS